MMNQPMNRNLAPGGTRASRGVGRRVVVILVALAACAAVVAAIVTANRRSGGPSEPAVTSGAAEPGRPATGPATTGPGAAPDPSAPPPPEIEAKVKTVLAQTEQLDRTVFAKEVEAQKYEEFFIRLWD